MSGVGGQEVVSRLLAYDTGTISDALDALGLPAGVGGLAPLWRCPKICGPARTVRLAAVGHGAAPPPGPRRHLGAAAIDAAQEGDVIVVANDGRTEAGSWGGLLSLAAKAKGVAGAVLDGACRDVEEAEELAFAVYGRGGTPRTARGRVFEESSGGEVLFAGIPVREGDWVMADSTGVVVVPPARAEDVLSQAGRISARESEMARRLRSGEGAASVMGANYEDMLSERGG